MIDFEKYLGEYAKLISTPQTRDQLEIAGKLFVEQKKSNGRLLFFGNGAASSISGHAALDFTKQGGIRSLCFHDPALITAYANDYGYENAYAEILHKHHEETDIVVFVSVSGESPNIIKAVKKAQQLGLRCIGFSGKYKNNTLSSSVDLSFWVESHAYNIVENVHSIWLLSLCDFVIGKSVYEVS